MSKYNYQTIYNLIIYMNTNYVNSRENVGRV